MADPVQYQSVGLNSYVRIPDLMPAAHRHNEVELLYLVQGEVLYRFGGRKLKLPQKSLVLFWSGLEHQVVSASQDSLICGLEIPLAWYLHWKLPEGLNQRLLAGQVLIETDEGFSKSDGALASHWARDLHGPRAMARRAALLEIEARLWRFASSQHLFKKAVSPFDLRLEGSEVSRIERMARYIAENCRRSLHVDEVARHVGLHPNYAMKLFSKGFGVNFNGYLNQFRIAHAQRALAMEDDKITEVGVNSGFGSLSRFNSNFRKACGMSPRAYRKAFGTQ